MASFSKSFVNEISGLKQSDIVTESIACNDNYENAIQKVLKNEINNDESKIIFKFDMTQRQIKETINSSQLNNWINMFTQKMAMTAQNIVTVPTEYPECILYELHTSSEQDRENFYRNNEPK